MQAQSLAQSTLLMSLCSLSEGYSNLNSLGKSSSNLLGCIYPHCCPRNPGMDRIKSGAYQEMQRFVYQKLVLNIFKMFKSLSFYPIHLYIMWTYSFTAFQERIFYGFNCSSLTIFQQKLFLLWSFLLVTIIVVSQSEKQPK